MYIEELIAETVIKDEDDLLGHGGDFCIVAALQTKVRPITFVLNTKNCSEKFSTLCQNVTGNHKHNFTLKKNTKADWYGCFVDDDALEYLFSISFHFFFKSSLQLPVLVVLNVKPFQ